MEIEQKELTTLRLQLAENSGQVGTGGGLSLVRPWEEDLDLEVPTGLTREKNQVTMMLCLKVGPSKEAGPGASVQLCR